MSVHGRSERAVEVLRELVHVGERTLDPEHVGGVDTGQHAQLKGLGPVLGAPHVGRTHPEQLLLGIVQARKERLHTVARHPPI